MPSVAIIDDNQEQSGTLAITLNHYFRKRGTEIDVITQYPFQSIEKYLTFIEEKNVCVLILDERLNDMATPEGAAVNYLGNELIVFLRERLKDFPIFMISNYIESDELNEKVGLFDYLLTRTDLTDGDGERYIPVILRAAQRYLDSFSKELAEFNIITQEVAAGTADEGKKERLQALQSRLEIAHDGFDDRASWLTQYESHIKELEILKQQILDKINKG